MTDSARMSKIKQFNRDNVRCARIILRRPDLYPGLMAEWAWAVLEKFAGKRAGGFRPKFNG